MDLMWRKRAFEAVEATGAERRRSVRQASLLEVARLTIGDRVELCRLRDVSTGGLCAEIYCPATRDERVVIELRTGHRIEGRCAWARGGEMGVEFDQPVPISEMLSHCSFDERVTTVRAPRVDADVTATLFVASFQQPAQVVNISQSGLKMVLDDYFDTDTPCTIVIEHLGPLEGEVKWWRGREGGLMFAEPIPYPRFADWRRSLYPAWRAAPSALPLDAPHASSWLPPVESHRDDVEQRPVVKAARRFGARGKR